MAERSLRVRRLEAGMTQVQLAEALGVHKRTVGRIENGERQPRRGLRERIERVLEARAWWQP